jgi:hypothetical protein
MLLEKWKVNKEVDWPSQTATDDEILLAPDLTTCSEFDTRVGVGGCLSDSRLPGDEADPSAPLFADGQYQSLLVIPSGTSVSPVIIASRFGVGLEVGSMRLMDIGLRFDHSFKFVREDLVR